MDMKLLLANLDLGSSVAEFDTALDRYFIETEAFRALALNKADIIAGEKGTGKTALFRVFKQRYRAIPELGGVEVIAGFNHAGNPVFQRLVQIDSMPEAGYVTVWKAYLLSLVGNWLLEVYESDLTKSMRDLNALLLSVGLRSTDDSAETIFSRLVNLCGHWLKPKSASVKLSITDGGIPVVAPTLEFGKNEPAEGSKDQIPHEEALALLDKALEEGKVQSWVVLDRLDEAFQGFPNIEIPALRALLRTYLD